MQTPSRSHAPARSEPCCSPRARGALSQSLAAASLSRHGSDHWLLPRTLVSDGPRGCQAPRRPGYLLVFSVLCPCFLGFTNPPGPRTWSGLPCPGPGPGARQTDRLVVCARPRARAHRKGGEDKQVPVQWCSRQIQVRHQTCLIRLVGEVAGDRRGMEVRV